MPYAWDENLETGHGAIDDQHRQLLNAVNDLQSAKMAGKGAEELESLMVFLITYTIKHFHDEEALQIQYQYPDYEKHRGYHNDFKKQVERLTQRLGAEGVSSRLADETAELIGSWLFNHIKGHDFKLALHIQSKKTESDERDSRSGDSNRVNPQTARSAGTPLQSGTETESGRKGMMLYTWDKKLETGHPIIDNQHKQLVSTVNRLQKANLEGKGADEIGGIMEFLVAYTVKHFQDEETLQAQYHYPDFAVHKNYHEDFKRQVGVLTQRMMTEGVSPELVNEVTQHVGDWLLNHIKGDDFKMAAYIQSRDISHERDGNKQPADL